MNKENKNNNNENKKEIISIAIQELIKMKIIKPQNDPFSSTKELLKNYNKLDKSIQNYEREIKNLQKSKNKIDSPKFKTSHIENDLDSSLQNLDIINMRIFNLYQSIEKIKCFKSQIEEVVEELEENKKKLIKQVYFEEIDILRLVDEYNCDDSTIYRRINKAIDDIKVILFPNKFIDSLLF